MAFTEQEYISHALFLGGLGTAAAFRMWMLFLWTLNIAFPFLPYLAYPVMYGSTHSQHPTTSSFFFGKSEQAFLVITVVFGPHIFFFLAHCLLVQRQYYCHDLISHTAWVIEWIITSLVSGGSLGTTALQWMNSLNTLRGKRNDRDWREILRLEAYIVFSPLILLGLFIILLVKEPEDYEQWEILKVFNRWWTLGVVWLSTNVPCRDRRQPESRNFDSISAGGFGTNSTEDQDSIPLLEPDAEETTSVITPVGLLDH